MNNGLKRILCALFSATFLVLTLGSCAQSLTESSTQKELSSDSQAEASEKVTTAAPTTEKKAELIAITAARPISDPMQKYIDKQADVLTNNVWTAAYRDELGIELSYDWTAPGTQYEAKLNQQIAAGDLPDIFVCNAQQLKQLTDKGMIADLTDLFAQHASDFTKQMMEADNHIGLGQATINKRLMAMPNLNGSIDQAPLWWVRKDWLDNLNLKVPTTMQELEAVAEAFAKNDPDQNGQDDTYGLGLNKDFMIIPGFGTLDAFMQGYHAYLSGWIKNGEQLAFGGVAPEVKTSLTALAKLYKNGAIDQEFMVKDGSKFAEEISAGKVGLFGGLHWNAFYPLPNTMTEGSKAEWISFGLLSSDSAPAKPMIGPSTNDFWVANVDMKHPEVIIKLYNLFYDKDPAISPNFDARFHGSPDANPDNPVTEAYWWGLCQTFYPKQNLFIHEGVKSYYETKDAKLLENYWVADNVKQCQDYENGDLSKVGAWMWAGPKGVFDVIGNYDKDKAFIYNAYLKSATDGMTQYNATLNQLAIETFTKIIMGEEGIDAFDTYVENWKKLGGEKITQEVNAAE